MPVHDRFLHPAALAVLLLSITASACSGGGNGGATNGGTAPGTDSTPTDNNSGSNTGSNTNTGGENGSNTSLPYSGVLTLDEIGWFLGPFYHGVIQVDLPSGSKQRVFEGSMPRWHAGSGRTVYRQACGDGVNRIVSGAAGTLPQVLTPCSSDVENPGFVSSRFEQSALSPDGTLLAVEEMYLDGTTDWRWNILVYEADTQTLLAEYEDHGEPLWLPDGTVLMMSTRGGLSVGDPHTGSLTPFADGLYAASIIHNPALSPDGTQIAFELDQQIWLANVDGSNPQSVIFGDRRFRFPAWSPDSTTLVYLGVDGAPGEDHYDEGFYFTHLPTGQHSYLDMSDELDLVNSSTVSGPITWH